MEKRYDVIIIGGGPAGLTAAIYMARARYSVLVMEKEGIGGQITITSEIVNYPGVSLASGKELTERMREQAQAFGAEFLIAEVSSLDIAKDIKTVHTDKGTLKTLGVIIATGANPRKLGFPGEKKFQGRGIAYCATCDGEFFTGRDVFVIGGGFAAAEEAVFLTKYARQVTVIVREDDFTCARAVADEAKKHPKIKVHYNTEILEAGGEEFLTYARFTNSKDGREWEFKAAAGESFGIFVFAGYVPATGLCKGIVELDEYGYIITDRNQQTNLPGVYAAGDVCIKNLRQVVTAVSDGAIAATSLEKSVAALYEKLQLERIEVKPQAVKKEPEPSVSDDSTDGFLTAEMKNQLKSLFQRFDNNLVLKGFLDSREISGEVRGFLDEIGQLSDKVAVKLEEDQTILASMKELPAIWICGGEEEYLGTAFHGVPGGHEFNAFVIALYNAAGPGQQLGEDVLTAVMALDKKISMKVIVSLSCTMCPDLVMAAQKIALENSNIDVEVYDLAHFPNLKEQYQVMSVPCLVVNDDKVIFGKKNISQLAEVLKEV